MTASPENLRSPDEARAQASAKMHARLSRLARYGAEGAEAQGIEPGAANRLIREDRRG
jgi:hypothetical protein